MPSRNILGLARSTLVKKTSLTCDTTKIRLPLLRSEDLLFRLCYTRMIERIVLNVPSKCPRDDSMLPR